MAVDTLAKRFSMMDMGTEFVPVIVPDGTIGAGDRAHYLELYSGIALGEPVIEPEEPEVAVQPSGGWSSGRASYFFGHDRELALARDREARRRAKQEARAEVARIAAEAGSPGDAAEELAAIRRAVVAESLAFGAFYRQLLDDAIARLRAEEESRMAAAAALEAERRAIARRRRDEEEVLLLVAML